MKWCLSSRQADAYLKKADEIKVEYRDRNIIYDLGEKYPEATVILFLSFDPEMVADREEIKRFNIYLKQNFIVCINNIKDAAWLKEAGIKFYYGYPINSFYEANLLARLGVCYIRLGETLFFDIKKAANIGIPIRAVPNIASEKHWPGDDGICGTWIRPEDIELYGQYITACEFEDCDRSKEQALYRIYAEDKAWPGPVNMLISNITTDATNRLIINDFATHRLTCEHACQRGKICHWCSRCLQLANEELLQAAQNSLKTIN